MTIYTLMPAFNEGSKIGRVLGEMPTQIDGMEVRTLVVDDGSTDGTSEVVRSYEAELVRLETNQGKGAALGYGLSLLADRSFAAVIWMDADGQHLPASIAGLVGPVLKEGVDLCVGSRYLGSLHTSKAPFNRRVVRSVVLRELRRRTGYPVTDPFSGFRCFSRTAYETLDLIGCGYESELETCFSAARAGLSYREVPIPRIYGPETSKMSYFDGAIRGRLKVILGYARTIARDRMRTLDTIEGVSVASHG